MPKHLSLFRLGVTAFRGRVSLLKAAARRRSVPKLTSSPGRPVTTPLSQLACPPRCNLKLPFIRRAKHNQKPNQPASSVGRQDPPEGLQPHPAGALLSPEHAELLCLHLVLLNTSRRPGLARGRELAELEQLGPAQGPPGALRVLTSCSRPVLEDASGCSSLQRPSVKSRQSRCVQV